VPPALVVAVPTGFSFVYEWLYGPIPFEHAQDQPLKEQPPPRVVLAKHEHVREHVCWKTVALAVATFSCWATSMYLYANGVVSRPVCFMISTFSCFVIFTPLHDAVHQAVSKDKSINNAIGHLSALPFALPMPLFRYVHLLHHRHNNNLIDDPDSWAGKGPQILLPLRWCTVILWYFHYMRSRYQYESKLGEFSPAMQKMLRDFKGCLVLNFMLMVVVSLRFGDAVWYCWILPGFVASGFLMYLFDYVPHRPHKISDRENPFKATSITRGIFSIQELSVPMIYQNYHLIHHLYPSQPVWNYQKIFWQHCEEFQQRGMKTRPLFDFSPGPSHEHTE